VNTDKITTTDITTDQDVNKDKITAD
jgi:hypothetical protein